MKRSNDKLTFVNRNWKFQVNGKYVGLFGLYNSVGDFNFNYIVDYLSQPLGLSFDIARFRPVRYNGQRLKVTAILR